MSSEMPAFAIHIDSCKHLFEHYKLKKESDAFALTAIGSVIVDLEELGVLKNVHGHSEEFLQYLLKTDPKYAPLALGMVMHEEVDEQIDKAFVNPKMQEAEEIVQQYKLSSEKVKLAAHYLIDHSVNCEIVQRRPEIIKITEHVKQKISHRHAHKIAYHLSTFFKSDKQQVMNAIHEFRKFDLNQYLSNDTASIIYGKFYLLQQALGPERKLSLMDKIKLALKYSAFVLGYQKNKIKQMCSHSIKKFSTHKKSSLNVIKNLTSCARITKYADKLKI